MMVDVGSIGLIDAAVAMATVSKEEWHQTPAACYHELVESVPQWITAVIQVKGRATCYFLR